MRLQKSAPPRPPGRLAAWPPAHGEPDRANPFVYNDLASRRLNVRKSLILKGLGFGVSRKWLILKRLYVIKVIGHWLRLALRRIRT